MSTALEITRWHVDLIDAASTFDGLVDAAAAWYDALVEAGHRGLVDGLGLSRPERCHARADEASLAKLEQGLGCSLSPSLRRFYLEVGGVRWGSRLATLALDEVASHVSDLRVVLTTFRRPPPELGPRPAERRLVPFFTVDGNFDFVLRDVVASNGESPIYFVRHDEAVLVGPQPDALAWLKLKLLSLTDPIGA